MILLNLDLLFVFEVINEILVDLAVWVVVCCTVKKKLVGILLWSKYCKVDCPWNFANSWKVGYSEKCKASGYFSRTVYRVKDIISFITVCSELCTTVSEKYRYFVYNNDSRCKKIVFFFAKNYSLLVSVYSWNFVIQLEIAILGGVTISMAIAL